MLRNKKQTSSSIMSTVTAATLFTAPLIQPRQIPAKKSNPKYSQITPKLYQTNKNKRSVPTETVLNNITDNNSAKTTATTKSLPIAIQDGIQCIEEDTMVPSIDIFNMNDTTESITDDIDLTIQSYASNDKVNYDKPITIGQLSQCTQHDILHSINLSNNQLIVFPEIVQKCTQLKKLNLAVNTLDCINTRDIQPLMQLNTLDLSYNRINQLGIDFTLCCYQLHTLHLDHNQLHSLPSLNELTSLHTLTITHNELIELPILPVSLMYCNIAHNQLSGINGIGQCTKLIELNISYNYIPVVSPTLQQLTQLEELDISHNQLTQIDDFPVSLTHIDVSFNQLINIDAVKHCIHLAQLNCSHNKLNDSMQLSDALRACQSLSNINILSNQCEIDLSTIKSILSNIQIYNNISIAKPITIRPGTANQRPTTSSGRPILIKPLITPETQLQQLNADSDMLNVLYENNNQLNEFSNKINEFLNKTKQSIERRGITSKLAIPELPSLPIIDSLKHISSRPVTSHNRSLIQPNNQLSAIDIQIPTVPELQPINVTIKQLKAASFRQSLLQQLYHQKPVGIDMHDV